MYMTLPQNSNISSEIDYTSDTTISDPNIIKSDSIYVEPKKSYRKKKCSSDINKSNSSSEIIKIYINNEIVNTDINENVVDIKINRDQNICFIDLLKKYTDIDVEFINIFFIFSL